MAAPGQLTPQQLAALKQQQAAEAAKRGMSQEEFNKIQREQLAAEATKLGLTPEQYINMLKMRALQHHQQQQQQQQAQPQGNMQHLSLNQNNPPNPKAIAVAKFLRSQNLKTRSCILEGQRKDMFKVKRAIRALESSDYSKAASKPNSLLPPVTDRASAENAFKLLPLSFLALRVSKFDPHEGHNHAKPAKKIKGLWTVKLEQHQETDPMMHYIWLYEGPQWRQKAMAAAAVVALLAVVLFPLWPIMLRQGVWYLSVGMMGLLGLFFAMSIFRLILFCVTVFAVPPGIWLFPNLFEDVGFFDSFVPLWGWQEKKKKKPKKSASNKSSKVAAKTPTEGASPATTPNQKSSKGTVKRDLKARVEDVQEE